MSEASAVIPAKAGTQKNETLEGWQFLPIKDFAYTTSGGTPKRGVAEYYNGDVPWVKSGDLNDGHLNEVEEYITKLGLEKSSAKLFKPGTLLIALYGATIGRLSILNFEASTNQAVCGISVPEDVDVKYLFYYLLSIRQKLIDQGKGGAQPNINQQIVKETIVPLAPPEQQKRIVAKIEEFFSHIDAGIEALKKAKQLLKQYRQSVLKAAVTGELTKEWREENKDKIEPASQLLERILKERRQKWEQQQLEQFKAKGKMPKDDKWKDKYKEPNVDDVTKLVELPDGWIWVATELLAKDRENSLGAGPFGTIFKKKDFRESGVPIIFLRHVKAGRYLTVKPTYMDQKKWDELFVPYSVFGGEILVTKLGDPPGEAAIYPEDIGPAMVTPDVIKLDVNREIAEPEFVMNFYNSDISTSFISELAFGTTRLRVTIPIFKALPVPIPSQEEQQEIVRVIKEKNDAAYRLEKEIDIQLLKAEKNKQSILASVFSGNL